MTVVEALKNAIENGHQVTSWTAEEILADINRYCEGLENATLEDIKTALKELAEGKATFEEWLDSRGEHHEFNCSTDEDKGYFRNMYEEYKEVTTE